MKKILGILTVFLLIFAATAAMAGGFGVNKDAEQYVTLGADETVEHDYFAAGEMVEISGTVNGDAYAAGGEILVDGTVNGDLLAAGGNMTISGKVEQDVRVIGGNVTISGEVGGNVTAVGGNIYLTGPAKFSGNLVAAGGNIRLSAPVEGNAELAGGTIVLSSSTAGFVNARADMIRLTSKSSVGGDLEYWSHQEASIEEGAAIAGETSHHQAKTPEMPKEDFGRALAGIKAFSKLVSLITALVVGLLLISIFPKFTQRTVAVIQKRPWIAFGAGALFLVVVPIIVGLLLMLVIGIKLAFILLAGYFMVLSIACVFTMMLIGYWFLRLFTKDVKQGNALLVGAIIYYLLCMIPVLGGVVAFVGLLLGVGSLLVAKKEFYKELKSHKLI